MSYNEQTLAYLFDFYIQNCSLFNDLSEEHPIVITETKFENTTSYFVIRNSSNICQKIYIEYEHNEENNEVIMIDEVKIVDMYDCYLETPFNVYDDESYILLKDLDSYVEWFSTIDENISLGIITPR